LQQRPGLQQVHRTVLALLARTQHVGKRLRQVQRLAHAVLFRAEQVAQGHARRHRGVVPGGFKVVDHVFVLLEALDFDDVAAAVQGTRFAVFPVRAEHQAGDAGFGHGVEVRSHLRQQETARLFECKQRMSSGTTAGKEIHHPLSRPSHLAGQSRSQGRGLGVWKNIRLSKDVGKFLLSRRVIVNHSLRNVLLNLT